jgi:ABC-type transport system involved in cytochrome c biogenesis ATPase subunit
LSARENLVLTISVLSLPAATSVDAVLERVGLGAKEDVPLDAFSSGMKQRFALARLVLVERDLILLDEPETHLDGDGLSLLQTLIAEWKARGAVVICATHSADRFSRLADHEIRLAAGHPDAPDETR